MSLERAGFAGDESNASGELIAEPPAGIELFSIMVQESEGRGWQIGGQGDFLDEGRALLPASSAPVPSPTGRMMAAQLGCPDGEVRKHS